MIEHAVATDHDIDSVRLLPIEDTARRAKQTSYARSNGTSQASIGVSDGNGNDRLLSGLARGLMALALISLYS